MGDRTENSTLEKFIKSLSNFGSRGSDSIILVDRDGPAGLNSRMFPFITVENTSVSDLSNLANFIL